MDEQSKVRESSNEPSNPLDQILRAIGGLANNVEGLSQRLESIEAQQRQQAADLVDITAVVGKLGSTTALRGTSNIGLSVEVNQTESQRLARHNASISEIINDPSLNLEDKLEDDSIVIIGGNEEYVMNRRRRLERIINGDSTNG